MKPLDLLRGFLTFLDLSGLLMLGLYFLQMIVAALLPAPRRQGVPDESLRFTFLIPALNEAQVIGETVRNLRATVPDARIVVIDDASEDATAALVQELAARDPQVSLLRRAFPEAREGKGKALNWAVSRVIAEREQEGADLRREIFVVVDADGRVTPELIPEARRALSDPDVMGAQARVRIRPSVTRLTPRTVIGRMLEQQQDLEFFIVRHVQLLRQRWHSVGLFGNGQFMRASYLAGQLARGVAPWPDCLSEDFASGLEMRLARRQNRMAFLESAVTQQGLPDLHRFSRQRARWTQGTMQCAPYLPRLWRSPMPLLARLDLTYFVISPWMNGVIVTSLLMQPVRWLMGTQGLVLDATVSLIITVINIGLQLQWIARYQLENRLSAGRVLFTLASLPVYGFALFLSLPMAYKHYFTGRRTWDKSLRHAEPGELGTSAD
ncbi:glycosyltransferase [Deinococcus reticulitermitis]|uniref:glycosyltransferase n=1 Tax=Deinococcus reticulitermitis TaxID=856736 RepID=UPI001FE08691|nr:glycosyltransferase [Deinococcus reticulitermitis]